MSALAPAARRHPVHFPEHLQRHFRTARQLAEKNAERPHAVRPTGLPSVDRLLSGGLHHGQLVELIGRRSSGRFSIVLATLAATTARGDAAALVDLGSALDPQNAADAEIVLERLLWIRPTHLKLALIATEAVIGAGFPLVVVDLGLPPIPGGRGIETSWLRLARAADAQRSTLLIAAPYRVSGTAASVVLRATDAQPGWSGQGTVPRLLHGMRSRLQLEKLRGRPHGATVRLEPTSTESLSPLSLSTCSVQSNTPEDSRQLARTG